ncbi:peptidase domain-containing ABC transporter [Dyella flagellata]|uniref:Colicin V biosynthesis protein n=1 Tax=Dyella flagellata TaxID=1867833 RepID=A0ABQ5XBU7_9GAMM|nr:peptidase domain-containing ABC transporter [Dyella flagellata]GLQ89129.1 colicin V biosynthesis protein [Dyella flagellata]
MTNGAAISMFPARRRLPLLTQTEAAECGLACLAMVAGYYGSDFDLASLRRRYGTSLKGITLARTIEIARSLGLDGRGLRTEPEHLHEIVLPCILHWNLNHFVVLNRVSSKGLEIYDPARGRYWVTLEEASKCFTGVVLELCPRPDFKAAKERDLVAFRHLAGKIIGLPRAVIQISGLALSIELLALILPFQLKWIMDDVLPAGDSNLLWIMAMAFCTLATVLFALTVARAWLISWLGATINAQWTTNLFTHLLNLPLDFFEKRHMGDIVSRFSSVQTIQNTFTGNFIEVVLDGITGLLTIFVLCAYSLPLAGMVVGTACIYASIRFVTYRTLRNANEESLVFGARQQSELMESVRGIQAIKLANKQWVRRARLANATVEASSRVMRSQRIALTVSASNQWLFSLARVLLLALGARFALEGKLSAGMVIAIMAYADQFVIKVGGLVDKLADFQLLRVHAERIADIAFADPEPEGEAGFSGDTPAPCIDLKQVGFRYAQGEKWVFRGLSLSIDEGESVAIVGPSGCGKSTLAKVLLGLVPPTEGGVVIGGVDLMTYGCRRYREMVAAVMQDDTLFAGSVADNIAYFNQSSTIDQIIRAAMVAEIHDEIMAMPMGYETFVGDMGSALSGGQKQRILLARALFSDPKILVLDEATSHLDAVKEARINANIKALRITRIILAHRLETIASADRVVCLVEKE